MKRIIIVMAIGLLIGSFGCATPSPPNINSAAYMMAMPEIQQNIREKKISIGMSIPECEAAWPGRWFRLRSTSAGASGKIEIYSVNDGMREIYLTVVNGRIVRYSTYPY